MVRWATCSVEESCNGLSSIFWLPTRRAYHRTACYVVNCPSRLSKNSWIILLMKLSKAHKLIKKGRNNLKEKVSKLSTWFYIYNRQHVSSGVDSSLELHLNTWIRAQHIRSTIVSLHCLRRVNNLWLEWSPVNHMLYRLLNYF